MDEWLSSEIPQGSAPALLRVGRLDPSKLAPTAEQAVKDLLVEGESANTRASYRSALHYWAGWFAFRYGRPITLPVPIPVVLQFAVDHAQRTVDGRLRHELPAEVDQALVTAGFKDHLGPMKLSTLMHRVSVLSKVHQVKEEPNPCQEPGVRNLLAKIRRAYAKRGALPNRKPALTREPLDSLLATCDDSLRGKRDRALLLMAWASGGRRRSEITSATMENLQRVADDEYLYNLAFSKTNQSGIERPGNLKPIVGIAAEALSDWLAAAKIKEGAIFRRIRRGDRLAEPLSAAAVRDIVMKRCDSAGIGKEGFSAHSLRSGFVTEAGRKNVPLADVMAMTGHASVNTVMRYFRSSTPKEISAARMLDTEVLQGLAPSGNE